MAKQMALSKTERDYIATYLDLHCFRLEHDNDPDCRERMESHDLAKWVRGIIKKLK
jgi:hypothetical protein